MKVLMVCLGNICRSPLAHGILEKMVADRGLRWEVDSAGTSGWHNGAVADVRSVEVARANGIDITNQRSRQLLADDLDRFDLVIAMDTSNYNNILNLAHTDEHKAKVKLMLNFLYPGENRVVPDPYYEGGFDRVYQMIYDACEQLILAYAPRISN